MLKKLFFLYFLLFTFSLEAQFYSGSQMEFGKNRVQHQDFIWSVLRFDKFEAYYNVGGKDLAVYTSRAADKHIADIERLLQYGIEEKIQFIVYNKFTDFKQSNIGLESDDQYNVGGVTRIAGRKVFVYYEGDHVKLDRQIRAGVAEVLVNQMMYGGNIKDMLKNSTLLTIPDWFQKGLISYLSRGWDADLDSRVRDGITTGKFKKFNHLTGQEALYAGHSIWFYIAQTYGESAIADILLMTKTFRNVENAFIYVLGVSIRNLSYDWMDFYTKRFEEGDTTRTLPLNRQVIKKIKTTRIYQQAKVSPDGKYLAYVTNELGQIRVYLHNLQTGKSKRIYKEGQKLDRIQDYTYPILTWHPTGNVLAFTTENSAEPTLHFYTIEEKKRDSKPVYVFQKILDMSYSENGQKLAVSGVQNGQTDIFVYNIAGGGVDQITKDIYDDLNPRFVNKDNALIFSSNRINDTLNAAAANVTATGTHDLFRYDLVRRTSVLKRLTNTPIVNETNPQEFDKNRFVFLSDENGLVNRYLGRTDSAIAYVDTAEHYRYFTTSVAITNYERNIVEHDVSTRSKKLAEIIYSKGKYRVLVHDLPSEPATFNLKKSAYRREQEMPAPPKIIPSDESNATPDPEPGRDPGTIDLKNYQIGEKKDSVPPPVASADTVRTDTSARNGLQIPVPRNYKIQYSTEYIVSQLDNTFLNASYQKFSGGNSPIYLNPGFTGFFKIGMTDLLEDHKIVGGMRLSGDLNSNEYILSYENRVRRMDRTLVLHRQALMVGYRSVKIHSHEARYIFKWPFTEVAALKGTLSLRNDRTIFLATDLQNLSRENEFQNWGGAKLEYVFDNTMKRGLNLYNGTRYKIFAEYYRQIDKAETDLYVLGADFRNYLKIHRDFIWANRFAASTSFGKQRLIYYMGGVDNWFNPRFDRSVRVPTDQNFAYQTLATNMRGFFQNVRNGNSFAVINSELRLPLFRYLFNKPIRSDFINNFQVVGFGDLGTAWTGLSPYDESNSLNTTYVGGPGNPITVIIKNHKEPIVGGYGFGLRSRLFGYFIRLDWAWGVEDAIVLPKITYLSFSLDF